MEEQLREFEKLKKNEIKAASDLKKIKAAYGEIEQDIVQHLRSNGMNVMWHHDTTKNLYYKLVIPDKEHKIKKRLPKKEDYVKWLEHNWHTLTRDLSRSDPATFYTLFIEQAMKAPAPKDGDGPKVHIQLKALTEEEFIKQKTKDDIERIKGPSKTSQALSPPATPQQRTAPATPQAKPAARPPARRDNYSDSESSSSE